MSNPEQQAELIEQYWAALLKDSNATPPADLAPEQAATVRRVQQELSEAPAQAEFRARLLRQLEAQANAQAATKATGSLLRPATGPIAIPALRRPIFARLAPLLALLILLVVSLLLLNSLLRPNPSPAILQQPTPTSTVVAQQVSTVASATLTPTLPLSATATPPLPTPIETMPGVYVMPPSPTWDPRIPTPKETVDMNMYLTPIIDTPAPPLPTSTPAPPTPAPAAETLSSQPISHQQGRQPLIWSSEAAGSLTIWLGYFSEANGPQLLDAHPILRWNGDFYLEQAKASPDGNSLAVTIFQDYHQEGGNPVWLYAIDLNTNHAQPVPDPMKPQSSFSPDDMMFGAGLIDWIDNERIFIAGDDSRSPNVPVALAVVTKDGASKQYCAAHPGTFQSDFLAMSPDRTTVFALVQGNSQATNGYWLIDANDCSKAHRIVAGISNPRLVNMGFMAPYNPSWSPDGKQIAFAGPSGPIGPGSGPNLQSWIWILSDPNGPNPNPTPISPIDKLDSNPVWSPDGKTIGLLRADSGPNGPLDSTNIFKYDLSSQQFSPLTQMSGASNSSLQWNMDSNYLIATSTLNSGTVRHLVAIDSATGKVTTLLAGSQGAQIVYSLLFK